ncbi:hypothetical protein LDO31_02800 [Luteimonas sp. XNQY3]|nr:hypothetical protein [Luteimonas sp. XNQY3]MCD9005175.1 hypothetical protein [Luteimonas sp. XNQY3]
MQFQPDKAQATIANVNQRVERHGDERERAVDIKFTLSASNTILDQFDKDLRKFLFRKPAKGEQQSLPTIGDVLTEVKFPSLEPQRLAHEFSGCEIEIAGQLDDASPIVLVDVKLKKFVAEPKEGGSVDLTFTASAGVDADELADISEAWICEDVVLTVGSGKRATQTDPEQTDLADAA